MLDTLITNPGPTGPYSRSWCGLLKPTIQNLGPIPHPLTPPNNLPQVTMDRLLNPQLQTQIVNFPETRRPTQPPIIVQSPFELGALSMTEVWKGPMTPT